MTKMHNLMSIACSAYATRQNYVRAVRSLGLYYSCVPEDCDVHQIKAWLIHERDKLNLSSSTLNMRVCGLKYYFRHIAKRLDLVVDSYDMGPFTHVYAYQGFRSTTQKY